MLDIDSIPVTDTTTIIWFPIAAGSYLLTRGINKNGHVFKRAHGIAKQRLKENPSILSKAHLDVAHKLAPLSATVDDVDTYETTLDVDALFRAIKPLYCNPIDPEAYMQYAYQIFDDEKNIWRPNRAFFKLVPSCPVTLSMLADYFGVDNFDIDAPYPHPDLPIVA